MVDLYATNFRELGGFTILDGGVALQTTKRLKLRLYCNNITNQKGVTTWAVQRFPSQSFQYVMRPRTAGLGIEYNFGK